MMLYGLLKFIHVLSSTILFGTGIGTAMVMFWAHRSRDIATIAVASRYVVTVDWLFTGISGIIQPITGFWMVFLAGYSLDSGWLIGSIVGYVITALCWFPVLWWQIKIRNLAVHAQQTNTSLPADYFRYYKYWFYLGWPAFISLLVVFYLMVNKP